MPKFFKPLAPTTTHPVSAPNPSPKEDQLQLALAMNTLTDIEGVAQSLGVSKRYVQSLVQRKVIPVIRIGRRCTRFDLVAVLAAVRRYEIEEIGRHY